MRVTRIWPIAKQHPIDRIADVRVSETQVFLQRKDASLLRRYVSPAARMQSEEQARWLAAHMKRALTMFGGLRK